MSRLRLAALAISLTSALHGAAHAATVRHAEPLRGLSVTAYGGAHRDDRGRAMPGAVALKPAQGAPAVVSFNAFSRDFALELEPNGRLAGASGAAAAAYRGKVQGRLGSWVRLVLTLEGPSGLVFDGETLYGIESGTDVAASGGAPAMFRLADVYFEPGELDFEMGAVALDGERAVAAIAHDLEALPATSATRRLELGAIADFEFSQAFGANAEAALLTRLNNVDGIFSEQLGVEISIEEIAVFTANDDPFTASAATALLNELANYRGATPSQDALGLTHLMTGRDLDGTTGGLAFIGTVCASRRPPETRSFGAGLSEARRGAVVDSLVAAHEIGHNFGAPHDGTAACAATPPTGFLMAASIGPNDDEFSACSVREMQAEIAAATCLTRIGPADMRVALLPAGQVFAGVSFVRTARIENDGADEATGVVFTATTESGLTIEAAEAPGASCTVLPGSASCAMGSVGGGATRAATLTLRAAAPGTFELRAAVAATSDQNLGNNSTTAQVMPIAGVDLVWSGAPATMQLNGQATITVALANAADFVATSVTVTAALADGLRPDQATLGSSACTISGQTVSCPTQGLAARGTVPLALALTGTAAGSQRLTVSAASNDVERNPADNQLAIAIAVNAPAPSGGGGAFSWLAVAALLAAYGSAHNRRRKLT